MRGKRFGLCLLALVLSLASGCTPEAMPSPTTVASTPALPSPTTTPAPTATLTPVPSPTPTPTPTPSVRPGAALAPENIAQLTQMAQIGRGEIHDQHWAPDGSALAVATGLGVVLFDGVTLELREQLPTGETNRVRFSPDGTSLAVAASDWVALWDLSAGDYRFRNETEYDIDSLTFNTEGTTLLVASQETVPVTTVYGTTSRYDLHIQQYDVTDGSQLRTIKLVDPNGRALSPRFVDGGRVIQTYSAPNDYFWWDAQTGQQLYAYNTEGVTLAILRTVGERALRIEVSDLTRVKAMDLVSGEILGEITPGGEAYGMFLSEDGQTVVVFADTISRWDVATLESQGTFTLKSAGRLSLIFAPDFSRAIVKEDGTLRLLDVAADAILAEQPGFYDRAWEVALSADGSLLAANRGTYYGRNTRVETWDTVRLERLAVIAPGLENSLVSLAVDAKGRVLTGIAELAEVRFWDPFSGDSAGTLTLDQRLTKFALTHDGQHLAVAHATDGSLWDLPTSTRLETLGDYGERVSRIALSEDGTRVALTYFSEYGAVLWDVSTTQAMITLPNCQRAVVSPDGSQFACYKDLTIPIQSIATGTVLGALPVPAEIVQLAYSPDSRLLVASCEDGALYFWEAAGGALLHRLEYPARNFAFSADGRLLVTAASDGTVRLWGIE